MVLQQLGVKKKTVEKNRTGMLFSLDFGPLIWDLNPGACPELAEGANNLL